MRYDFPYLYKYTNNIIDPLKLRRLVHCIIYIARSILNIAVPYLLYFSLEKKQFCPLPLILHVISFVYLFRFILNLYV